MSIEDICKQIDELHLKEKFDEIFKLIQDNMSQGKSSDEFLW